jgi:3-oxoacyl-(acyl-carrier-protein) synthase
MIWACEGVNPSEIAYVNAHGTGTPSNDEAEALAITDLGLSDVPVGSFKGAIGHAMAAAGALELAGCLMGWTLRKMAGTTGFSTADPRCALRLSQPSFPFSGRYLLKNSFGFGGQNASILLGAP